MSAPSHPGNFAQWEKRIGADRMSNVEEFDQAISELAKVIVLTALESELSAEYAPVIGHLVKARRVLRETFGIAA